MVAGETGWTLILPTSNVDLTTVTSSYLRTEAPDGITFANYTTTVGTVNVTVLVNGVSVTYLAYQYCQMVVATGQFAQAGAYKISLWLTLTGSPPPLRKALEGTITLSPTL